MAVATVAALIGAPAALAYVTPDRDFGDRGRVVVGSSGTDWFADVATIGEDLVAVGRFHNTKVIIAKYSSTGRKVTSFGDRGRTVLDLGQSAGGVRVYPLAKGDLLVTAITSRGFALVGLHADGSLNRDFGDRGIVQKSVAGFHRLIATVDSQGRIIIATGQLTGRDEYKSRIHVWRYKPNGTPDRSFAGGDTTASPSRVNQVTGVATDSADRILLVTAQYSDRDRDAGMSLVRVSASGDRVQVLRRASAWSREGTFPIGLDETPDGLFLAGITGTRTEVVGAVAFTPEGRLAGRYADKGILRARCGDPCYVVDQKVDDQGALLMVGGVDWDTESEYVVDDTWVSRFTPSGRRDGRFSPSGWALRYSANRGFDQGYGIDINDSGAITIAGRVRPRSSDAYLARFKP